METVTTKKINSNGFGTKQNVVLEKNIKVKYLKGAADTIILINPKTTKPHTVKKGQEFSILQKDYDKLSKRGYIFETKKTPLVNE